VLPYEDAQGVALSPVSFLSTLLRHRRRILAWIVACGVTAALATLLLRSYGAESSFAPQTTQPPNMSSLAGLASQFGFNLPSLGGGPSLDFYASVAESRAILTDIATTVYRFPSEADGRDTLQGNLIDLLKVRGDTRQERLQRAVKKLSHMVRVTKDEDAGVVTIEVTAKWPTLAEQINRRLVSRVNELSLSQHQDQAAAERGFMVGRLQEVRAELDSAEDALRRFFEENRTYQNSPRLIVEQGRLQRHVDLLQQVYVTLAEAYERARIEEARNTPVIAVIDKPEESAKKTGSLPLSVVVGMILGGLLGLAHGLTRDYMSSQRRAETVAYAEFASLRAAALRELTALPRGIAAAARLRRRS
jgi:uncharacterized protein involved in exopolysaccharide biosynthesis